MAPSLNWEHFSTTSRIRCQQLWVELLCQQLRGTFGVTNSLRKMPFLRCHNPQGSKALVAEPCFCPNKSQMVRSSRFHVWVTALYLCLDYFLGTALLCSATSSGSMQRRMVLILSCLAGRCETTAKTSDLDLDCWTSERTECSLPFKAIHLWTSGGFQNGSREFTQPQCEVFQSTSSTAAASLTSRASHDRWKLQRDFRGCGRMSPWQIHKRDCKEWTWNGHGMEMEWKWKWNGNG